LESVGSIFHHAIRSLAAMAVICLGACASYQPKPIALDAGATAFAARSLDAPEFAARIAGLVPQAPAWPPAHYDRAALLIAALAANPKLDVARAQMRAARAQEDVAARPTNPDLTLQSEYARHDPHPWLYGFAFDLDLRSPALKRAERAFADLGTRNAQWQWLDQVWTLRRDLIAAFSEVESARRRLDLLDRLAAVQDRLITIEEKRVAAGEDAPVELLNTRQARSETTQQQAQAHAQATTAQANLAAAIGMPPQALDGVALVWPEWGEPPAADASSLDAAREQALLSRSDLATAVGDYAQSENKLHQAVLRQYPQFHLSPGYYWDHGIGKFPLDAGFSLPLFSRAEIHVAQAQRDVAGERLLALQAQIYGEIAAAERAQSSAHASVEAAASNLDAARERRRQAEVGQRLGALGSEELVAAQVLELRGELDVLQARAQWQAARNALEDALHAPLSGPELGLARELPALAEKEK
jgi:outer membrane protein TolC